MTSANLPTLSMQLSGKDVARELGLPSPESRLESWLSDAALEMLPNATSMRSLPSIPLETEHSVTNLPSESIDTTIDFALKLAQEKGRNVVPHIAASRISREKALAAGLALGQYSIDHIFVMNGDNDGDSVAYSSSLELLEDLHNNGVAFNRIGIVGHPEGHPSVESGTLDQALRDKQEFADQTGAEMYVVTQLCFDPSAVLAWTRRIREVGIHLPVKVGMPGPIDMNKLIAYSAICGAGDSAQLLAPSPEATDETSPGAPHIFNPYTFLQELIEKAADPNEIEGLYFYTFNEPRRTQEWISGAREAHTKVV